MRLDPLGISADRLTCPVKVDVGDSVLTQPTSRWSQLGDFAARSVLASEAGAASNHMCPRNSNLVGTARYMALIATYADRDHVVDVGSCVGRCREEDAIGVD